MISRKIRKALYNTLIILLLAAGAVYVCSRFIHPGVEYTDNAQVRQHITPVNTRIQGFIRKICFEEYQPVHKVTPCSLLKTPNSNCSWPRLKPIWLTPDPASRSPRPAWLQ